MFGVRKPSIKKSISARLSPKRAFVHGGGFKMPRGFGAFRNPKRAFYNYTYNRTTIGLMSIGSGGRGGGGSRSLEMPRDMKRNRGFDLLYACGVVWTCVKVLFGLFGAGVFIFAGWYFTAFCFFSLFLFPAFAKHCLGKVAYIWGRHKGRRSARRSETQRVTIYENNNNYNGQYS